jgi:hypothetical protein
MRRRSGSWGQQLDLRCRCSFWCRNRRYVTLYSYISIQFPPLSL